MIKNISVGIALCLCSFSIFADQVVPCSYNDNTTYELESNDSCGTLSDDGLLKINKEILNKERWSKYGLSCINVHSKGWFYINQNGLGRNTPFSGDNDCVPFTNGVAVGTSNGKVIFYNQLIEVVKRSDYSFASVFYLGFSKVCRGVLEKEYDQHGEHYSLKGGVCGYIDTEFNVVVPLQYSFENTPKPGKL